MKIIKKDFMKDNSNLYNQNYYLELEYGFKAENRSDHKRILELLRVKPKDRVLEIGCGFGVLLKKIPSEKKEGIETNDVAIEECRKRGLLVTKANAEKGLLFKDSSFDIVIMNEVIEHFKNPERILKECYRVLSPKGKVIITTPVRSIFVRNLSNTHFSEMTVKEIRELLHNCGFKILSHEVSGISFIYPILENIAFKPFRFLKHILKRRRKKEGVKLIDSFHGVVDYTILKPFSNYRRYVLNLGQTQLILAEKI